MTIESTDVNTAPPILLPIRAPTRVTISFLSVFDNSPFPLNCGYFLSIIMVRTILLDTVITGTTTEYIYNIHEILTM